jgi:two-component system, response regulator
MSGRTYAILLVEDNDDDAELATMAFTEARIRNPIVRARTGEEALEYLFAQGRHAERDLQDVPAVILLDIKLPGRSGLEILNVIRNDEKTRRLPVVILTSSNEEADRLIAYDRFANSYVRKPVDYDQFVRAAHQLGLYWTIVNEPPPPPSSRQ